MSQLSKVPAFGFESYKCFAKPHLPERIKNHLPLSDLINDQPWISQTAKKVKASVVKQNTLKALSYIPGVSFGIGIYHLHAARTNKQFSGYFILRGVLELLGLSFLLLLPDLILKCQREQKAEKDFKAQATPIKGYEEHITQLVKSRLKLSVPPAATPESAPSTPVSIPEPEPVTLSFLQQMEAFFSQHKRLDKLLFKDIKSLAEKVQAGPEGTHAKKNMLAYVDNYFQSEDFKKNEGWQAFQELAAEHGAIALPGVPYDYYIQQTTNYIHGTILDCFISEKFYDAPDEKQPMAYTNAINKLFSVKSQQQQTVFGLLDKIGVDSDPFTAILDFLNFFKGSGELASKSDAQVLTEVLELYFSSSWFEMRTSLMADAMITNMVIEEYTPSQFENHTAQLVCDLIYSYYNCAIPSLFSTIDSAEAWKSGFEAQASQSYKKYGMALTDCFSTSFYSMVKLLETKHSLSDEIQNFVGTGEVSEELYNAVHSIKTNYWFFQMDIVQGIIYALLKSALDEPIMSLDDVLNKFAELPFQFETYDYEALKDYFEEVLPKKLSPSQEGALFFDQKKMTAYLAEIKRFDELSLNDLENLVEKVKEELTATYLPTDHASVNQVITKGLSNYFHSEEFIATSGWKAFQDLALENGSVPMSGLMYDYYLSKIENYASQLLKIYGLQCDSETTEEHFKTLSEQCDTFLLDAKQTLFGFSDVENKYELFSLFNDVGLSGEGAVAIKNIADKIAQDAKESGLDAPSYLSAIVMPEYFETNWFKMRCEILIAKMSLQEPEDSSAINKVMSATQELVSSLVNKYLNAELGVHKFDAPVVVFTEYGLALAESLPKNMQAKLNFLQVNYDFTNEMKVFLTSSYKSAKLLEASCFLKNSYPYLPKGVVQGMIQSIVNKFLETCNIECDKRFVAQIFSAMTYEESEPDDSEASKLHFYL